jgi:hypothetical protein
LGCGTSLDEQLSQSCHERAAEVGTAEGFECVTPLGLTQPQVRMARAVDAPRRSASTRLHPFHLTRVKKAKINGTISVRSHDSQGHMGVRHAARAPKFANSGKSLPAWESSNASMCYPSTRWDGSSGRSLVSTTRFRTFDRRPQTWLKQYCDQGLPAY